MSSVWRLANPSPRCQGASPRISYCRRQRQRSPTPSAGNRNYVRLVFTRVGRGESKFWPSASTARSATCRSATAGRLPVPEYEGLHPSRQTGLRRGCAQPQEPFTGSTFGRHAAASLRAAGSAPGSRRGLPGHCAGVRPVRGGPGPTSCRCVAHLRHLRILQGEWCGCVSIRCGPVSCKRVIRARSWRACFVSGCWLPRRSWRSWHSCRRI